MKKTIAILLVAVLAAGSIFAGFSGEASVKAGVDLDKEEWGFLSNGTNVKFNLSLGNENVEKAAEGDIYASIKAEFEARVMNDSFSGSKPGFILNNNVKVKAKITEAKVNGSNWYVSILGVPGAPDFAKSAIDTTIDKKAGEEDDWGSKYTDETYKAVSYKVAYNDGVPGIEAGYADYVAGVGFNSKKGTGTGASAYFQTPEYAFDAVKVQGAAVASKKAGEKAYNYGASAKASYATDVLATSLATDMGLTFEEGKDAKFAMDLAANFKYDFVTVDAYLNTAEATKAIDPADVPNPADPATWGAVATPVLLSAKVSTDLTSFNVPVKLEVTGKNLLAKTDLGVKATIKAIENLDLTVSGGYVVNTLGRDAKMLWVYKDVTDKPFAGQWSAKVGATYTAPIATISGEVSVKNWGVAEVAKLLTTAAADGPAYVEAYEITAMNTDGINTLANRIVLGAKVSVVNETLIPGAKLKLAWEGKDLVNKVKGKVTKGTIAASCTIAF